MPVTNPSVNATNFELTPCQVIYNGVDLGATLGNVAVTIEYEKADLKADQYGGTILDRRVSGLKMTVATELAEYRLKDNLKVVWPHANLINQGGVKSVYFVSKVGESDLSLAHSLVLHPLSLGATDKTGDYNFYLATADAKSGFTFSPTEQGKVKVTWQIYPDTSVAPAKFLLIGDPTNIPISASAGSPTAGVGNVGNGTVTSVAVVNGYTKTETITISCVGQTSGNNFSVTGSLSGPLGDFHIAAASGSTFSFTSNYISFLMTQGSTQCAYGDSFTIATTAANYA